MTKRLLAFILPFVALVSATSCEDVLLAPDDAATQIEVVSGNAQSGRVSGALAAPIVVRLLDKSGNPVVGATVRFVPDTGSGTVSLATALTDAEGRASVSWTLSGTFGTKTLRAEAGTSLSVAVTATVVPDRLELVSGNSQVVRATGELPAPIVVQLIDLTGKPAAGVTVTFEPAAGGGQVVPSIVVTGQDGTARALWTLGSAIGPTTLRVSAASATSSLTVNATATQDRLLLVSGGSQAIVTGGTLPQPVVVELKDQTGAAVKGVQVTFAPPAGSGTVSPSSLFTDNAGRAQTNWTVGSTAGAQTLQVTSGSATPLTVAAAALGADSLQVVSGNAQAGRTGAPLGSPVVVRVLDRDGRVVRGAVVTFIPAAGSGTVGTSTVLTDSIGEARTTWTLGSTTGTKSLTATAGAASVTVTATATADRLQVKAGDGQVAQPSSALASPVEVELSGLDGTLLVGVPVTFVASGDGTTLPGTVATDAQGRARTTWTLGSALGVQQLTVTAGSATTVTVTATAAQSRVTLVSGGGQSARIGATLADVIVVKLVDPSGAAVPNTVVTFTPAVGSGTVVPATRTTDAQGLATTAWTLGATPGAMSLTASAPSADALELSARALRADSVFLSAGGAQSGLVGAALPQDVVVEIRDRLSQVVMPGIAVTFAPNAGTDGTVSAATVVTDAAGLARTTWTLGTTKGAKNLTVTTADAATLAVTATFIFIFYYTN